MNILSTIASGVAGWLTYEDMLRQVRHHEESVLHGPILNIAQANGYSVKREFPLPRTIGQLGAPKQVDFVLASSNRKEFVVLELKFKKSAKAMAGSVSADARKIADIDDTILNGTIAADPSIKLPRCGTDWKIRRSVLLVWREGDVADAMQRKSEHPIIRKQLLTLLKGIDPNISGPRDLAIAMLGGVPIRPFDSTQGHLRFGSTLTRKRYWVGILNRQPNWRNL